MGAAVGEEKNPVEAGKNMAEKEVDMILAEQEEKIPAGQEKYQKVVKANEKIERQVLSLKEQFLSTSNGDKQEGNGPGGCGSQ